MGADLVMWLSQCCRGRQMALILVDDLQWADGPSARALLFAARRLQADRVLVVAAARSGELARLGEGWQRFLAGDHRAGRVHLGGLGPAEVAALGRALGAGELPRRAVSRLLQETGGNPLYCRAVLEEAGAGGLDDEAVRVPRSLAGLLLLRLGALSPAARQLAEAAAVLGQRCGLAAAAALAGLADPLPALGEALNAGILIEELDGAPAGIGFSHLLMQRAVYEDLSPVRRRRLHARAAGLVDRDRVLGHRVAAAAGPDEELAGELEAAGRDARRHGRAARRPGSGGRAERPAGDGRPPPAGRAGDPGRLRRGGPGRGPGRPGGDRRAGCAAQLAAGHAGFPGGPGRCGRGPAARGVAGPRPGPGPGRGRRGRYPASTIVLRRGPGPRGHRMGRAGGRGRRSGRHAPPGSGRAGGRSLRRRAGTRGPGPAGVPARRPV